ncbi:MAG: hypothetical protein ACRCYQ_10555 [Nocardioides sp.]
MRGRVGAGAVVRLLVRWGLVLGLVGCSAGGGDAPKPQSEPESTAFADQVPKKVQSEAIAEMKAVTSARMAGQVTRNGLPVDVDLVVDRAGTCLGTVRLTGSAVDSGAAAGKGRLIVSPKGQFVRGNKAFWRAAMGSAGNRIVTLVGKRWAKMPEGTGSFGEICGVAQLLDAMGSADADGEVEVGATEEVDGVTAVKLTATDDDRTTAWVSIAEPHYIVKLTLPGPEPATLVLSDFNEPVVATPPSAKKYVDLSR